MRPLGAISLRESKESTSQEFINATFFSVGENGQSMEVNSLKVVIQSDDGKIFLENPFGRILSSGEVIRYQGNSGEVFPVKSRLTFWKCKISKIRFVNYRRKNDGLSKIAKKAELLDDVKTKAKTKKEIVSI